MLNKEIRATCKRCGKQAPVDEFVLDKDYKMMVCQACVKEKTQKTAKIPDDEVQIEEVEKKPAGWDKEDEYLERSYNLRQKTMPKIEKIDSDTIRYTCQKCGFKFVYQLLKQSPSSCPYCGTPIGRIRSSF